MNRSLFFVLIGLCVGLVAVPRDNVASAEPVRLIFDTDIGNDVDDALALGVIHALQSRDKCRLIAVTVTKDNPLAAELVDAINTFYGRGDIPIGIVHHGVTPEAGKFLKIVRIKDHGHLRFPHDLDGTKTPDATVVLRKALSKQPDHSVVIAQVGFSTNLARLLDSPPDAISPLSGRELVKRKVRLLSMMAGSFGQPEGENKFQEYNIKMDVSSARNVAGHWPTPIVFSGFEVGIAVRYPAVSIQKDYNYVAHHPLAEAYCNYMPPPHNRPCWDLTSVLYAVMPDRGYFGISSPGSVAVNSNAVTRFKPDKDGTRRFLKLEPDQVERVREALVQLASAPPCVK